MKFSVIIPVYNVVKYLPEAIASIKDQTEGDWECICVDDGSTDGSGDVLDAAAAQDARICVIHQSNQGVSAARNAALDIAKGEWIVYLDGDDLLAPWALAVYADMARQNPDSDVLCLGCKCFQDGNDLPWKQSECPGLPISVESEDLSSMIPTRDFVLCFFQYAYRRAVVGDCRFDPCLMYGEDRVYLMDCLARVARCSFAAPVTYGYRMHEASCVNSKWNLEKSRNLLSSNRLIHEILGRAGKKPVPEAMRLLLNQVTEFAIDKLSQLSPSDRRTAWREWQAFLPWILTLPGVTWWRRLTVMTCRLLPFYWIAIVLYAWPQRLKEQGVHR